MKVSLFYPPVGNACQPYLSTAALAAFLKQNGVEEVAQYDFNLEALDELLSPERLLRAYRWCYHHLDRQAGAPLAGLSDFDAMKLQLGLAAMALGPETAAGIDGAKAVFRSAAFHRPERYQQALDTLRGGYQLLSARYFPTVLSNQGLTMRYRMDSSDDILTAVRDERENPFLDVLSPKVEDVLAADGRPDVAGVSIGYFEQLVPGLTLAWLLKRHSPGTHVTVGGTMLSAFVDKPFRPEFFELFDSAVFFEGELPLLRLAHAVARGEELSVVPSLLYRQDGEVRRTPICPPLDAAALPVPDFGGLPLERYLSPEPILPVAGSRGCYWRRCTFCSRQHFIDTYRSLSADAVVEHLRTLHERHGARAFFFVDECLSPAMLRRMAERLAAERLDLRWSCYSRFEARLADPAFCRTLAGSGLKMVYFGLESACQRVIERIQKGTEKATMARILEAASSAGILNMILWFVGFPTETREEALESMQFLLDNREHVTFALAGQFLLEEASPIYRDPASFDITRVRPLSERSDMGIVYDYETASGMSAAEAAEVQELVNERTRELHARDFLNRAHLLLEDGGAADLAAAPPRLAAAG